MQASPSLIIRADASPRIGTGHVMRCLALALAARRQGIDVTLSSRITVGWLREGLQAAEIPFHELSGIIPQQELPADLLNQLGSPAKGWVVLDGYHFGPDCHTAVREAGYKLMVIDDYCHLPEYHCEIFFNQNIGAERLKCQGQIEQKLLGPNYALLRPEFLAAREGVAQRLFPPKARHILLSLGGGNFLRELTKIAPLFAQHDFAGRKLRVIAGAMPEAHIRSILADCPASLEVLSCVNDMPTLMHWADLCISAGGSTCWELCCLGVPFLTVEIAKNQSEIVKGLAAQGVAPVLEMESLRHMILEAEVRQVASKVGMSLVDGNGAARVLATMQGKSFYLRNAEPRDCSFVWQIASDTDVRAVSGSTFPIPWDSHQSWFGNRLKDENTLFYIIESLDANSLGYLRFQRDRNVATVSIALASEARGRGVGTHALCEGLRLLCKLWPHTTVQALIARDNIASQSAFSKAGFVYGGETQLNGRAMLRFTC